MPFLLPGALFYAYFISYPIQVFTLGSTSGIFGKIIIAICLIMLARAFLFGMKITKKNLCFMTSLAPLPLFYFVSASTKNSVYYDSLSLTAASLYLTALLFSFETNLREIFEFKKEKKIKKFNKTLLLIPLASMSLAIILNSLGAIPPEIRLENKYFYGVFIRAGGGYVDPNALGLTVIITLAIFWQKLTHSKILTFASVITAIIAAAFTFSRTTQIMTIAFFLLKSRLLSSNSKNLKLPILIGSITILFYISASIDLSVFFERYSSDEGASSTNDRIRQIKLFLEILNQSEPHEILLGYGGQPSFQMITGSAMHATILTILLDVGAIPFVGMILFYLFSLIFSTTKKEFLFRFLCILSNQMLPFIPELFFLYVFYVLFEGNIMGKKKIEEGK